MKQGAWERVVSFIESSGLQPSTHRPRQPDRSSAADIVEKE
jgi:hypothetical protein